ncbi:MAG TPA: response regulator transcription factor [Streptosporangiaceae bacterium]|jgi:two-component system OmpR family response regulator
MKESQTPGTPRVLIVDDEPNIRDLVSVALRFHGFTVETAANGKEALRLLAEARADDAEEPVDLVVLDVMLPDIDGFELCRRLRAEDDGVPVIFLTARDTPSDTVTGLTLGGDDYVTKPFSVEALIARVGAVLRRTRVEDDTETDEDRMLRAGDLEMDEENWTVLRRGVPIDLSPTEFRLLAYLMHNAGRVLSRELLLERVWGWDYGGRSQVLETYISYLRRKLEPLGPPVIHTQRGIGYSLRPSDPARE